MVAVIKARECPVMVYCSYHLRQELEMELEDHWESTFLNDESPSG